MLVLRLLFMQLELMATQNNILVASKYATLLVKRVNCCSLQLYVSGFKSILEDHGVSVAVSKTE